MKFRGYPNFSASGLLHSLLNINNRNDLERHPKIGASWEGFVLDQVVRLMGFRKEDCYFWATHAGAELDKLVIKGRQKIGFEVKLTSSPKVTHSMRNVIEDLNLDHLFVIHSGDRTVFLDKKIEALAFPGFLDDLKGQNM